MTDLLHDDFQIQHVAGGVRYQIWNLRSRPSLASCGCFALLAVLPLVAVLEGALVLLDQPLGVCATLAWVGVATTILSGGWWLVCLALIVFPGRATIEVRGPWLWFGIRLGFWRWGQRIPVASIAGLSVHLEPQQVIQEQDGKKIIIVPSRLGQPIPAPSTSSLSVHVEPQQFIQEEDQQKPTADESSPSAEPASTETSPALPVPPDDGLTAAPTVNAYLFVEREDEPATVLLIHPNPEVAQRLGEDLRQRLLVWPEVITESPGLRQPVSVIHEIVQGPFDRAEPPRYSSVFPEERPDGLVLTFPPRRIRSPGELFWFLNQIGFAVGIPALFVCLWGLPGGHAVGVMSFLWLYWLIDLLVLNTSLREYCCNILLLASPEGIQVRGPNLLRRGYQVIPVAEIENLYGLPTGVYLRKPGKPLQRLNLRVQGVLEAQWVATQLRRVFRLPRPGPAVPGQPLSETTPPQAQGD